VDVLRVHGIAAGGDGVGRLNGMAVFVPRTAPGDSVQVAWSARARHGRGRVLQVLEPSAVRVTPACPHYEGDRCGGCQLQHLSADAQREARQHIVQESLRRIGHREVSLPNIVSDVQWAYRSRLTLTLVRRGAGWVGGLHPHDDATRVFPLEVCLIAHPALVSAWHRVREVIRARTATLPDMPTLRLSLRLDGRDDAADPAIVVVLQGGRSFTEGAAWGAAVLAATASSASVSSVWWIPEGSAPQALASTTIASPDTLSLVAGDADVPAAGTGTPVADNAPDAREALAFAQVNRAVATALQDTVAGAVLAMTPGRLIDAYAGTGRLSVAMRAAGIPVIAIESDASGAQAAATQLAGDGPSATVVCDLVERALPEIESGAGDVVVLNPPRRGVDARVTAWLEADAQRAVRGVVYVSCDPATLARDLARMPSWSIASVQCFDMFPQTAHVETVCILQRGAA
jgi:23S rRNA (uracil1939-C5)-methyltransferase